MNMRIMADTLHMSAKHRRYPGWHSQQQDTEEYEEVEVEDVSNAQRKA